MACLRLFLFEMAILVFHQSADARNTKEKLIYTSLADDTKEDAETGFDLVPSLEGDHDPQLDDLSFDNASQDEDDISEESNEMTNAVGR